MRQVRQGDNQNGGRLLRGRVTWTATLAGAFLLAVALWPVGAQHAPNQAPAPAADSSAPPAPHATEQATPEHRSPGESADHATTSEPVPATEEHGKAPDGEAGHTEAAAGHGTESDANHAPEAGHAGDAHTGGAGETHAAAGGGHAEEEEGIGIHLPTVLSGLLKEIWHRGPATVTAAGAVDVNHQPIDPALLVGKQIKIQKYEDHHDLRRPRPTWEVKATVATVGNAHPQPGDHGMAGLVDGAQVQLIGAEVAFAYKSLLPEHLVGSVLTVLGILLGAFLLTRNLQRIPNRTQAALEHLFLYLDDLVHGIIGHGHRRYLPMIGTLFIYILVMNLAGLIPGWLSPTGNVNVTAGLALIVVVFTQYEGIRVNGLKGYLMHFVGEPKWLGPLNVPIHFIGEIAKVLSLSIRLFGNIFGEDVVIIILMMLGLKLAHGVPFQLPMYLMAIFTSLIQALVFTILTSVYIALMTSHDDHGESHGHSDAHGHGHGAAAHAVGA